jgi:hypothetical protein
VLTAPGLAAMKAEVAVLPDGRSRISDAERKAHETALMSAYRLQEQLAPARQSAQALMSQLAAIGSGGPAERMESVSREAGRIVMQLNSAMNQAARAQSAIDAYEGAPTAAQVREVEWAWEDGLAAITSLNRLIREEMPSVYEAAGASARWRPIDPVPAPKRTSH